MAELYVVISSYMIIKTSKQRTAAACAQQPVIQREDVLTFLLQLLNVQQCTDA